MPTLLQEDLGRIETDLGKDLVSTAMSLLVSARDSESVCYHIWPQGYKTWVQSQTVPTLLQEVQGRIETDLGKDLVSTAMSLLVSARDGESVCYHTWPQGYKT